MKQVLFWLEKGTIYICDEVEQPTEKAYYTTIKITKNDTADKLFNRARNNLCKQIYRSTGVWWQYIHFAEKDIHFKVLEDNKNE